jgi:hypothetical protein
MFKKQYVPMLTPNTMKKKTHMEHKVISKRDEERIKNIHNEQHKVIEMLNRNLEYRNNFLRSQRIMNYNAEKSRLIGLESQIIGNLRYYAPPVGLDDFPKSKNRLDQLEKKMDADILDPKGPNFFFNTRYF